MNNDERKEAHKILDKKGVYSFIQSWRKWKLLKITKKQGSFTKKC